MKRGRASTTETPRQLSSLGGKDEEVLFRPRHRKPAGLRKRSWPSRPKNAPHHTPLPGPAVPAPPAPDSEGPLHGSSAGARANEKMRGSWRRSRTTPHGKGGNWGLEGGRASPGCIPIDDMSPHHHHHTSFPLIGPPPFPPFRLRRQPNTMHTIGPTIVDRQAARRRHRWHLLRLSVVHSNSVVA